MFILFKNYLIRYNFKTNIISYKKMILILIINVLNYVMLFHHFVYGM